MPVLAPEIAAQNEQIDASDVGIYSGLLFLAAMWTSSLSGWFIARLGAIRTNQIAAFGSGIAVLLAVSGQPWALIMTAVCVGACYGPNTPSGSQVLSRAFSPRRRGFAFSIKQSGAPLGAMLAGFALPLLVLTSSWQQSLPFVTLLGLIATVFAQP